VVELAENPRPFLGGSLGKLTLELADLGQGMGVPDEKERKGDDEQEQDSEADEQRCRAR
jgi:hypothetical protein